jgi:hypothetical protein
MNISRVTISIANLFNANVGEVSQDLKANFKECFNSDTLFCSKCVVRKSCLSLCMFHLRN